MAKRRKSIRLSPDEHDALSQLYTVFGIPSDQYAKRPDDLGRFVNHWRNLTERSDSSGELMHYIKSRRKKGRWVTFDGKHERLQANSEEALTIEQWAALEAV